MKTKVLLMLTALSASAAMAQPGAWPNRPNVLAAARVLATEVEHLDDSLHGSGAPEDFIRKVHHFEETVTEFVDLLLGTAPYGEVNAEFNHIREDIRFLDREFPRYPHLLANPVILREWRATRAAYRRVDHEMLRSRLLMGLPAIESEPVHE